MSRLLHAPAAVTLLIVGLCAGVLAVGPHAGGCIAVAFGPHAVPGGGNVVAFGPHAAPGGREIAFGPHAAPGGEEFALGRHAVGGDLQLA